MRFMYDAITPSRIEAEPGRPVDLVAGYVDGSWPSAAEAARLYPDAVPVSIAVFAWPDAQVLDVEFRASTPAQAPDWAIRQRGRGQVPTVYCSESVVPAVLAAFDARAVARPLLFIAHYGLGPADLATYPRRVVGLQYRNTPGYDVSVVRDYWPGVDEPRHHPEHHHPHPSKRHHRVVRAGDTLSAIATRMGVSLAELEAANPHAGHPAGNFDLIMPGDVIYHPRTRR